MKISAKAEYACLAVLALARQRPDEPPLRIRQIAEANEIPERYLVQILLQLKGAGLVASTRGAAGGYRLARPAAAISLGEVLAAIDGPDETDHEALRGNRAGPAILASVGKRVRAVERGVLDSTSIAQLVEQAAPREWTI